MKEVIVGASILFPTILFFSGCGQGVDKFDHNWAKPTEIAKSMGSLEGDMAAYNYRNNIIVVQSLADSSVKCLILKPALDGTSCTQVSSDDIPRGYTFSPTMDALSGRMLFLKAFTESNHLEANALLADIAGSNRVQVLSETKWIVDQSVVFNNANSNVMFDYKEDREPIGGLGIGIIDGDNLSFPYSVNSQLVQHNGLSITTEDGPSSSGVFNSANGGETWQLERVADCQALEPWVCKTSKYDYFFGTRIDKGYQLWFSCKPVRTESWTAPEIIAKTYAKVYGNYMAASKNDIIHLCWMDRRHNKWRFNIDAPPIENDDIYYSHRKDSDSSWSKGIHLSKGVLYCYAPTISAEGDNVVVAWAGIQSAGKYHTDYDPNDIYYVTSKDGGNTWSQPLKVTDVAKDGMTAGEPKVMLLNGVIHLFYIEGKNEIREVAPGLVKLNQPPWPIYYTQRPFPN